MKVGTQAALGLEGLDDQFKLVRIQMFDWGTFSGVHSFEVSPEGYLLGGPTGAGKSTILDAHTSLLSRPRWMQFNTAARDSNSQKRERTDLTYVRGAWAQKSSADAANETVTSYLRGKESTWSVVAEVYLDGRQHCVTLLRILWVRGASNSPKDVHSVYAAAERAIDLREFQFFGDSNFDVKRIRHQLPDVHVFNDFGSYQERFRRLLGIENERALHLLHKTQSAKSFGDLNEFLRTYMLDEPDTFKVSESLVDEFVKLEAAHKAVVEARKQVDVLTPAKRAADERLRAERERLRLQEVQLGIDAYVAQFRLELLQERVALLKGERDGSAMALELLETNLANAEAEHKQLMNRRHEHGGSDLELLQVQLAEAVRLRPQREAKNKRALSACSTLGLTMPETPERYGEMVEVAVTAVQQSSAKRNSREEQIFEVQEKKSDESKRLAAVHQQLAAMELRRSLIPYELQAVRAQMLADLGFDENKLPFAGELMQVRNDELQWRGAIERVLGGLARNILVEETDYQAVAEWMQRDTGQRIRYLTMRERNSSNTRAAGPKSLSRKVALADTSPYCGWLGEELRHRFDYECVDSTQEFRAAVKAVMVTGQVKHNVAAHEKDDRQSINDKRHWVLGFDAAEKVALFQLEAEQLQTSIAKSDTRLIELRCADARDNARALAANTLQTLTWLDIDIVSAVTRIAALEHQVAACLAANPDLARLDQQISAAESQVRDVRKKRDHETVRGQKLEGFMGKDAVAIERIQAVPTIALTPTQQENLERRFNESARRVALEPHEHGSERDDGAVTPDVCGRAVERGLVREIAACVNDMAELKQVIEAIFVAFNAEFKSDSADLDPVLASADGYFAKLDRLLKDGLPAFEARFLSLLTQQTDENLVILRNRHQSAAKSIEDRLESVNDGLRDVPFHDDTHLEIKTIKRPLREVAEFLQSLRDVLTDTFNTDEATAEARYAVLARLVRRLGSQDKVDVEWRELVLDVRKHVDFIARELNVHGQEIEVYRGNDGKSGGQRQKLTATILASALRYQLGGSERTVPRYSTVVLDEAFVLADSQHTSLAMNIFREFGFQMLIAAPLDKVRTLEKFVGGAAFITIRDRKHSIAVPIEYDTVERRLQITAEMERDYSTVEAEAAPT
ncbi:ATP-binding protein [Rhizobacter fulvus]